MVSATGHFTIRDMSLNLPAFVQNGTEKDRQAGTWVARTVLSKAFVRRSNPEKQVVQFLHARRFADNGVHF